MSQQQELQQLAQPTEGDGHEVQIIFLRLKGQVYSLNIEHVIPGDSEYEGHRSWAIDLDHKHGLNDHPVVDYAYHQVYPGEVEQWLVEFNDGKRSLIRLDAVEEEWRENGRVVRTVDLTKGEDQ